MKVTQIFGCEGRGDGDQAYLTRYTLFENNSIKVCIHVFHRSDSDELHDHPWNFLSLILWQGYLEQTPTGKKRKWPLMLLFRKAHHAHRVELINGKKAVTFVIMGKRIRKWGFFTKDGWLDWNTYFEKNRC